jgi:hypothetical protein
MTALARLALNYSSIVTSHEAERQTSAVESCGILVAADLSNATVNLAVAAVSLLGDVGRELELPGAD